jgi:hypothetical protein
MSTQKATLLSLTFQKEAEKRAKIGVLYNIMPVLGVDLHSFTKNISIFSGNDAYVFPKTCLCFSENISIISESAADKSPTSVKLMENSVKSTLFTARFRSFF